MSNLEGVPGYAQQVYSGWVWVILSKGRTIEYRWSKAETLDGCLKKVEDVVRVHGISGAFDDDSVTDEEVES